MVESEMRKHLIKLEKELRVSMPTEFPLHRHGKESFCAFAVTKKFPQGMPWDGPEERTGGTRRRTDNGRIAFVLTVKTSDLERMKALLDEAKEREL